jgi:TonB family protein
MAPIAKENETVVAPANLSAAGNPAQKASADPARSQPVALEIPVTVNGARTIEGSDKREPFSESTQTVLVFTNGAVLRLASALASGQLVFLTNEKTKKEVVCQVVKSKNYRTVTGYVELEFTEPAPGFWGMRFPATATGPAPTASAPVAPPRPVPTNVTSPVVPAAPKAVPPPAPAPVAAKPVSPMPPAPPVVIAPPTPAAIVTASLPHVPEHVAAAPILPPPVVVPSVPPVAIHSPSVAKHEPSPNSTNDYSREIAAIFSVPQAPAESKHPVQPNAHVPAVVPAALPVPPVVAVPENAAPAKASSTDDLKLQAARLQEQLSAMLFTETPAKPAAPSAPAHDESAKIDTAAHKVLQLTQADLAPAPTPTPLAPPAPPVVINKVTPSLVKPVKSSLDSEEVQIPAWLAPLARNAETATPEATTKSSVDSSALSAESTVLPEAVSTEDSSHREQPSMFGGQLLTDSSALPAESQSLGSKKGLFFGLAAAAILVVAGAAWYSKQPGNFLTGAPAAKQSASQPTSFEPVPALGTPENSEPFSSAAKPTSAPTSVPASQPSTVASSSASVAASLVAKNNSVSPSVAPAHTAAPVEQPRKPTLGDVRLATPVVNHSAATQDSSEGEPALVASQVTPNADSFEGLTAGHGKGPAAPTPIGGDVKQARLLKSVPPIYPQLARAQHISGNVQIDALIDAQGNVTTMKVLSGSPMLHQAALTALKQWKYAPAMLDGNPTSMHLTVTVQFRVQ